VACVFWSHCEMSQRRVAVDSPQIVCHAAEAEVGERNVCVRCDVKAKPVATTVFWIVADNGSSVLAGQVTDDYWVVIKVIIDQRKLLFLKRRTCAISSFAKHSSLSFYTTITTTEHQCYAIFCPNAI